jgi:hypothetical protein
VDHGGNMQRYSLNLKGGTYTEGGTYELNPIFRQQVVPGQTVNIDFESSLKTAAFTKNLSTPAIMSVWFFYVPHRLVWNEWTDFISKQETAPTFPTTTYSPTFFDRYFASSSVSPLYRRAYKMVYNEYFGTESVGSVGEAWYDDITTDIDVALCRTKNPEDFASKITLEGTVTDPEFNVTASSIPLNDFYRQMMNARSQQRSQMTGDKYVDTLARMGVDATWMIAERPEFLGTKSQMVGPQLTANTSDTNTGEEVARFQAKLKCSIKSKHFAEHGYIVGVSSCRPLLNFNFRGASDVNSVTIDDFYSADNLQTKDITTAGINGINDTTEAYVQRFAYLKNGQWLQGDSSASSWNLQPTPTVFSEIIYPSGNQLPISDELGTADYAVTSSFSMTGKTPVPNKVA